MDSNVINESDDIVLEDINLELPDDLEMHGNETDAIDEYDSVRYEDIGIDLPDDVEIPRDDDYIINISDNDFSIDYDNDVGKHGTNKGPFECLRDHVSVFEVVRSTPFEYVENTH